MARVERKANEMAAATSNAKARDSKRAPSWTFVEVGKGQLRMPSASVRRFGWMSWLVPSGS